MDKLVRWGLKTANNRNYILALQVQPTGLGLVKSSWERAGDSITVTLELPEGVSARIKLPGREEAIETGIYRTTIGPDSNHDTCTSYGRSIIG